MIQKSMSQKLGNQWYQLVGLKFIWKTLSDQIVSLIIISIQDMIGKLKVFSSVDNQLALRTIKTFL
jgi:hypothetical protein